MTANKGGLLGKMNWRLLYVVGFGMGVVVLVAAVFVKL